MGLFNMFSKAKKENFPSYLVESTYGTPKWSTQKDEDYLRMAYNRIVWVYACVSTIAGNVSTVPWELYRINKINGEEKQIKDHPILKLVNGNINSNMTSKDFFDLWATYLATQGKFYALLNNPIIPTQIYPLYGHKVKPIPSLDRFVSGFEYDIGIDRTTYKDNEVIWSKFNDPLDFYEGMSPIRALARTVDTENEAVDWNKAQLQNQAVPPGALRVQNPSPELQNNLRSEWLKRYSGAKNARVPLVLNAEKADYVQFGLSTVDMDFIQQRQLNRVEICAAFGIPSQVVGDPQGQTYANYEEADKAMWKNTLIPKYLEVMKQDLNLYITKKYNENLELRYCLDDVTSLQEDINSVSERARLNFKFGLIKQNEARKEIGFDDDEDGDKFVYELTGNIDIEKVAEDEEESDKKKLEKAINMINEKEKEIYWKALDEEKRKFENATKKQLEKTFEIERINVNEIVKNNKNTKNMYNEIEKYLENDKSKQNVLIASYKLVARNFYNKTYNDIAKTQKQDNFLPLTEEIEKYLINHSAEQVVLIDETTLKQIKEIIEVSVENGLSVDYIASLIDNLYLEKIIPNRSTVIARTEVIGMSNYASIEGARKAEDDFDIQVKKIWIRTFDDRVRDTHAKAGSHKPIGLNEKFKVGSSELQYPADPNGDPSETIQCRCAIGYVDK